ncbi:MAG: hypothetical protein JSU74_03860 [Candidatus Zixiibacteriota bacterium]|nr:MAG: hypothetical protein JSU74_03860 [candidate division Zixibacteria bacterium]
MTDSGVRQENQTAGEGINRLTIISIASVAWILFVVLHEVIGHAAVAAALGEDVRGLATTTAHIHDFYNIDHVAARIGEWGFRAVCAGGAVLNFVTAFAAIMMLTCKRLTDPAVRYFLWLFATVSIVQQAFWMTILPFTGLGGDWVAFLNNLRPSFLWKSALTLLGVTLFFAGIKLPFSKWRPVLPADTKPKRQYIRRLTLEPIAVAFMLQLLSVLFAPLSWSRYGLAVTVATFVPLGIWLAVMMRSRRWPVAEGANSTIRIDLKIGWIAAALILTVLFVAWLGPGIGSFEGHPQYNG